MVVDTEINHAETMRSLPEGITVHQGVVEDLHTPHSHRTLLVFDRKGVVVLVCGFLYLVMWPALYDFPLHSIRIVVIIVVAGAFLITLVLEHKDPIDVIEGGARTIMRVVFVRLRQISFVKGWLATTMTLMFHKMPLIVVFILILILLIIIILGFFVTGTLVLS